MSERDSLAAQLRAQLVKANESLAYLKETLDATWCMVDVKDLEAIVAALGAAADRLEVLEQEKTTHRWVQHSNSRDAESLAACQRELADAQHSRDMWKAVAEAAEAERDRYKAAAESFGIRLAPPAQEP